MVTPVLDKETKAWLEKSVADSVPDFGIIQRMIAKQDMYSVAQSLAECFAQKGTADYVHMTALLGLWFIDKGWHEQDAKAVA